MEMYEIHLYVPKLKKLKPSMVNWLMENGMRQDLPEAYWPIYKLKPRPLARLLLRLDPSLMPVQGAGEDVELHYPNKQMGIVLYVHDRGVILFFPYMAYTLYSRIVLGICYTYVRYLYDHVGFWSYDPQLDIISFADDFKSIEDTARLMDSIIRKQLKG